MTSIYDKIRMNCRSWTQQANALFNMGKELETKVDGNQTVIEQASVVVEQVAENTSDIADNTTRINTLNNSVGQLGQRVEDAEDSVEQMESEVTSLTSAVGDSSSGLVKDVADLKDTVNDSQTGVGALNIEVANLELDKQDVLTAGQGITISNNVISASITGALIYKGRVSTSSSLPLSPSVGDMYYVTDEAKFYAWSGTSWDNVSGSITIDTALDSTSTNAVENRVITQALAGKQPTGSYATTSDLNNYATTTALTQGLATKQDSGDYATNTALTNGLATKQNVGDYVTSSSLATTLDGYVSDSELVTELSSYATTSALTQGLATKQDNLTAGTNITIANNVISATGGGSTFDGNTGSYNWIQQGMTAVTNISSIGYIQQILQNPANYDAIWLEYSSNTTDTPSGDDGVIIDLSPYKSLTASQQLMNTFIRYYDGTYINLIPICLYYYHSQRTICLTASNYSSSVASIYGVRLGSSLSGVQFNIRTYSSSGVGIRMFLGTKSSS